MRCSHEIRSGDHLKERRRSRDAASCRDAFPTAGRAGGASDGAWYRCEEIRERAKETLEWARKHLGLLSVALDHLSLGRAALGLALASGGNLDDAALPLDAAVHGLRAAGHEEFLSRGLIDRATLHRFRGDAAAAEADLEEALDVAERGSMRLYECDAHLEWARLRHSVGDPSGARRHLDAAQALVASTGYRRREREVADLDRALAG